MASRFLHGYYVCNGLLLLTYAILRVQRLRANELGMRDIFGVSREAQIYFCVSMLLFVRVLSAPTADAYLSTAFMFCRCGVLLCLWYMDQRLCAIFFSLWIVLYIVCPQPRFQYPKSITALNHASFEERITKNKHKSMHVVWVHATWSSRCTQLAPVYATLASRFAHVRIRFSKVDVGRWPGAAKKMDICVSAASHALPCAIVYRRGVEIARFPKSDQNGRIDKRWKSGFIADDLEYMLRMKDVFKEAEQWEADARQLLRDSQRRAATKQTVETGDDKKRL